MTNNENYFEFLKVVVGNADILSFRPTDEEWECLFLFCQRQALIGIGFTAVEKLHEKGIICPKNLMRRWFSLTMQIEQRNRKMNEACKEVTAMFDRDGFDTCVLKGQGNLLNYPKNLAMRRQSGDIDLLVMPRNGGDKIRSVIAYARKHGKQKKGPICDHIDMYMPGDIEVEAHYRIGHISSPIRYKRLLSWFDDKADECMKNRISMGFSVPTVSINVVYQMTHVFKHFFDEGVGLRQLMDYYFVLNTWHNYNLGNQPRQSIGMHDEGLSIPAMSREEIAAVLCQFGMLKFASAVMWVLQYVLAMPDALLICEPNEKEGRLLLREIMEGGNFGQHDSRSRDLKTGGMLKHGIWKLQRIMRLLGSYPEEALCEPFFRVWHLGWRVYMNRIRLIPCC